MEITHTKRRPALVIIQNWTFNKEGLPGAGFQVRPANCRNKVEMTDKNQQTLDLCSETTNLSAVSLYFFCHCVWEDQSHNNVIPKQVT